jgi:hypothetical protein
MSTGICYVAEPTHVREVSLMGTVDLAFWQNRLADENLVPAEQIGRAQVLIVAATMKYMAVRFTEVSFSILLSDRNNPLEQGGAFLVQAFNSFRPFAFIERVLFATPYRHAECRVSVIAPISMQIVQRGEAFFRTAMAQGTNATAHNDDNGWEGPIFLPRNRRRSADGCMFFARARGRASRYLFKQSDDMLFLASSQAPEVIQLLRDSQFTPTEWIVREGATHGKSKTFRRSEGLRLWRNARS